MEQLDLSERAGLNRSTISNIERNKSIKWETLEAVVQDGFGLTFGEFFAVAEVGGTAPERPTVNPRDLLLDALQKEVGERTPMEHKLALVCRIFYEVLVDEGGD